MFQIKFVEKIKTQISSSITLLFFFENHSVYEKMWKNVVQPGRPQMTIGACPLHAGKLRLQAHTQDM